MSTSGICASVLAYSYLKRGRFLTEEFFDLGWKCFGKLLLE